MTTITINDDEITKLNFKTTEDLFEYLVRSFKDKTILTRTSFQDLNQEEQKAWTKHKESGYTDFIDFKE